MANVPSIKATGFQSASDDLAKLVTAGRLTRADLEKRLRPTDFPYLDKSLAASSWVPIETYVRVLEILIELEGKGDPKSYCRARGRRAGERLHKVGLYKQFNASTETWGKRAGSMATTMGAVLYNFTRWSYEAKEGRHPFQIVVDDARGFPEFLRFVAEGFTEYLSLQISGGREAKVTSQRVTPDKIVFTVEVE